jgi:ATP-dependent Clp protease ATP-binding subunit ClpB
VYGARPLKRVIQRELQNPLASAILEGRVKDGDAVRVGVGAKGLTLSTGAEEQAKPRRRSA